MALKIVYKICCGIDVHKTFVVACIASTDKQGVTSYESHRFSTYTKGLKENPEDTSFDLEPLVFKSLKKKLPELRDAIDGYIAPEQEGKLKIIKAHFESLESRKAELEELILALAAPYQQELTILQTAPGISNAFTAIGIISEIGTNMEAFPSAKHLCSWAGLTPTSNESAGKKKSVRVSKAGCYIKPLLV